MADDTGPKLWIAFAMAVLGSAFTFGWNLGVTNLPEPFIRCWIQESLDRNQFEDANVNCSLARDTTAIDPEYPNKSDLIALKEILEKVILLKLSGDLGLCWRGLSGGT